MNFKAKCKRFFTLSRSAEGFTLVELIVVIAILGILSGIGIPGYAKYIKSSEEAVEKQQLAMYHNAYVVACVGQTIDPEGHTPAVNMTEAGVFSGLLTIEAKGTKTPQQLAVEDFNAYFGFDKGETYTFKHHTKDEVAESIRDGVETGNSGVTDNGDGTYTVKFQLSNGTTLSLVVNKELADKLKNNNFADSAALGADVLLNKVDTIADIAAMLLDPANIGKPNSTFEKLIYTNTSDDAHDGGDYIDSLIKTLGLNDEDAAKLVAISGYADGTLNSSFLANSLVLTAASKTQGMDTSFLGGDGSASTLRSQLDSTDKDEATTAMAKLAMTYGMYTSYVNSNYAKDNNLNLEDKTDEMLTGADKFTGMTDVLASIEDDHFAKYLASDEGKADLAAYQASMQIINDAANESPDAAMDILANGFNDPDLVAVLSGLMGN